MTAPVDVLAVMDFRIDQAVSNWRYHGQDDGPEPDSIIVFRQARAAVAELIEAAAEMNRLAKGPTGGVTSAEKRAICARMDAALAAAGVR